MIDSIGVLVQRNQACTSSRLDKAIVDVGLLLEVAAMSTTLAAHIKV